MDFVVVDLDQGGLVLVHNCNVGLIGSDYFSKESIIGYDILFQLSVDNLQACLIIRLSLLLHAHDGVDRVN